MLQIFSEKDKQLKNLDSSDFSENVLWYDLQSPILEEIQRIEGLLQIHIPSLEEMLEIEESSRLYEDNGVLYMTSMVVVHANTDEALVAPVAFILTQKALVTVRYADAKPFHAFAKKITKNGFHHAEGIFLGLLDTIVERVADILEMSSSDIDRISTQIFRQQPGHQSRMTNILKHIGRIGDLNSKVRASLETLNRQLIFYHNHLSDLTDSKVVNELSTIQQDLKSLSEFLTFLYHKINFLLSATLGYVNIEQNNIIKIFSVAAVIFLPPTLIASIYGMNFHVMPELHWFLGYPVALLLMAISAFFPYLYFKRKGWL